MALVIGSLCFSCDSAFAQGLLTPSKSRALAPKISNAAVRPLKYAAINLRAILSD
jgi:hypothetical protein